MSNPMINTTHVRIIWDLFPITYLCHWNKSFTSKRNLLHTWFIHCNWSLNILENIYTTLVRRWFTGSELCSSYSHRRPGCRSNGRQCRPNYRYTFHNWECFVQTSCTAHDLGYLLHNTNDSKLMKCIYVLPLWRDLNAQETKDGFFLSS